MTETWLAPTQMARRLGVSAKALRVYERAGLITPLRTGAGWRAYGPREAARLHQVLALKSLGLSLRRIAELLSGGGDRLDQVLALQQKALAARRDEVETALARLTRARATLAQAGTLTLDDLTTLTKETVMSQPIRLTEAWTQDLQPIVDRHFTDEDKDQLKAAGTKAREAGYDQAAITREWEAIFEEARILNAAGDTDSARACELARRWMAMAALFTRGDPKMSAKASAVWSDALADPELGPRLPGVPDLFRFVSRVQAGMVARGEWAAPTPP